MLFLRPHILGLVASVAILGGFGGFFAREPLQRTLFLREARARTGMPQLDVARVERDGDDYVATGLHTVTPDRAFELTAASVRVHASSSGYAVELDAPAVRFAPQSYRDLDRIAVRDAFAGGRPDARASITIKDGTLEVAAPSGRPEKILTDKIDGVIDVRPSSATFDGSLALESAGKSYPIAGKARLEKGGELVQGWHAPALPVVAFAALIDRAAPAQPAGGMLRDLDVEDGMVFHASARLDGVAIAFGKHRFQSVNGDVVASKDGLGSNDVAGTLDGQAFTFAGEVHDLHSHYRWLTQGTADLEALANLGAHIASEPNVRAPIRLEVTAPGVVYGQYAMATENGPLAVSVLSANPSEPTLRIDTAIAADHVISGGERTSAMGLRTGAIAGVNGDYFDIGRTYQPQGMLVRSGTLIRGPTDRAVLAIDKDNRVTFGEFKMTGRLRWANGDVDVTEFNSWPPGDAAVITTDYGVALEARRETVDSTFVALEPLHGSRYRVSAVTKGDNDIPVTFGVALGPLVKMPLPRVGETVDLTYATDPPTSGVIAAIGGGPILLRNGRWYEDKHAPAPDERDYRWPVIALALTKDGRIELVAVDGRHPERSVGMTRPEFGDLLIRFGATDAMALDSGGSVTLVSRAPGDTNVTVRNVPSDSSSERWVSDALFLYSSADPPTIVTPAAASTPVPEDRPTP